MKLPNEVREFFRRQGARGGRTRARNLTAEQRSEGARKAVQARWAKVNAESEPTKSAEKKSKRGGKL